MGELMRRGEVMVELGLSPWQVRELVAGGTLKPIPPLYRNARALFRRVDVEGLVKPGTEKGKSPRANGR